MGSTKYEVEKVQYRKNNLSPWQRRINSANSLQGLIGKRKETSEDEQLMVSEKRWM